MKKKIIIFIIIYITLFISLLLFGLMYKMDNIIMISFVGLFPIVWALPILLYVLFGVGVYKTGGKYGKVLARKDFEKEIKKVILNNPYEYFREIPNKYGIGVAAFLLNYDIDNQDVLAAVLDLCAKGYINLKQNESGYEIINNNKPTNDLLSNELYVLNWILQDKEKFDVLKWKQLSKNDSINLGLSTERKSDNIKQLNLDKDMFKKLYVISLILSLIFCICISIYSKIKINDLIIGIPIFTLLGSLPLVMILFFITLIITLFRENMIKNYKKKNEFTPNLTESGKIEFNELYSLGKFLNDFSNFADKHINEIVIWEQYLSYSLLFRISEKVMKPEYEKIKINDSFIINNIDNIKIL